MKNIYCLYKKKGGNCFCARSGTVVKSGTGLVRYLKILNTFTNSLLIFLSSKTFKTNNYNTFTFLKSFSDTYALITL